MALTPTSTGDPGPTYDPSGAKKDPPRPSASKKKPSGITPNKTQPNASGVSSKAEKAGEEAGSFAGSAVGSAVAGATGDSALGDVVASTVETNVAPVVADVADSVISGVTSIFGGDEEDTSGPQGDGAITKEYSSEAIDAMINDIAGLKNPCDIVGEFFEELADQIDELKEKFDQLVDLLIDKIANFLGVSAIIVKWVVDYALFRLGLKKEFNSAEVFKEAMGMLGIETGEVNPHSAPGAGGGGCGSFTDDLRRIAQNGLDSNAAFQEAQRMKRKWGGFDPTLDEILDDPSGWIRDLGSDFENLCNMIVQYECAKRGGLKVTQPSFGLGFPIPLIEILEEGPSPWIIMLLDVLEELDFKGLEAHEHYDKIVDEADGFCSCGDL